MKKTVKLGIIGMGRIGKLHANNLLHSVSNGKIAAVADIALTDEVKAWAAEHGIEGCYDHPKYIFEDPSIDAVFICSSTASHADYIMEAAKAGKHIFCEKPIDFDLAKIKKALSVVKEAGVKLQVGFVRRFDHNHKKVRDTVLSGKIGVPNIVKVTARDPDFQSVEYVKTSGGLFMDMMIHDLDMARYLANSDVTEIMSYGTVLLDPDLKTINDIDTAIVMLKFENGALGVIDDSRKAVYGYDQRTEVHCSEGCVRVDNDLKDTSMIFTADNVICEKPQWFFLERYNDAFAAEAAAFVDSVLNDTPILATGEDGLKSAKLAVAAKISLDERRPVLLSELE